MSVYHLSFNWCPRINHCNCCREDFMTYLNSGVFGGLAKWILGLYWLLLATESHFE